MKSTHLIDTFGFTVTHSVYISDCIQLEQHITVEIRIAFMNFIFFITFYFYCWEGIPSIRIMLIVLPNNALQYSLLKNLIFLTDFYYIQQICYNTMLYKSTHSTGLQ